MLFLPFMCTLGVISGIVLPRVETYSDSSSVSYPLDYGLNIIKGNEDINISIIKRDYSQDEADLFKKLFFKNQIHAFTFSGEGDIQDEACYDDRLPVNIIIHKGDKTTEAEKDFVDKLRKVKNVMEMPSTDYGIVDEDSLFKFDTDTTTEEEAIQIQTLQKKMIKNSVYAFLDRLNNLVYVVNGTTLNQV
ncbi:hypothetical protein PSN45_002912 [Yamadazyma tenuis]|uniref:Uncharacterized protein n=1 Tax=Candida tenuis (strain ATCC 10573 / BCRC 21748 / CBS 615 / JCM 9827 / NBRC 10315 / NRRL Y-1498 / VKM Y-70) TaxID=590646 RepID=G3AWA1_CANTC|nr:uncharacterized protein CANTEDRAFT_91656 [Yamadazyma tenuis ATCC 10573]EGV66495.1 hypothetical protein CANTEDRAFT_91656 [Yamadazyma tenuis ATCC 10573]WEJ95393.1 hypothetical protein PSN45_002912 [Yamadazyma tenuis]